MSSSFEIKHRLNDPGWQLHRTQWSDVYIEPFKNCHPDYASAPIGDKPGGVKMCIRKRHPDGSDPTHTSVERQRKYFTTHGAIIHNSSLGGGNIDRHSDDGSTEVLNGYHKYQSRMYTTDVETAGQPVRTLSHGLSMRKPPHEERNISRDLIKQEVLYNTTGINPVITPAGINEHSLVKGKTFGGGAYKEYGLSVVRTKPQDFDVSRLEQPSKLWQSYNDRK